MATADLGNPGRWFVSYEEERRRLQEAEDQLNAKHGTPGLVRQVSDLDPTADQANLFRPHPDFQAHGRSVAQNLSSQPQGPPQGSLTPPQQEQGFFSSVGDALAGFGQRFRQGFTQDLRAQEADIQQAQARTAFLQGQAALQQMQGIIQGFEIQQAMRMQQARENVPVFKLKAKHVLPLAKQAHKREVEQARQQGLPEPAFSWRHLEQGTEQYNAYAEPGMQVGQLDMDTMLLTGEGRLFTAEHGLLPPDELQAATSKYQQTLAEQRAKLEGDLMRALPPQVFANMPLNVQQQLVNMGMPGRFNQVPGQPRQVRQAQGMPQVGANPEVAFAGEAQGMPAELVQGDPMAVNQPAIPPRLEFAGIDPNRMTPAMTLAANQLIQRQQATDAETQKTLTTQQNKHLLDVNLEREKSHLAQQRDQEKFTQREKELRIRGDQSIEQINRRGDIQSGLKSIDTTSRATLMKMQSDLNTERDRQKGLQRLNEIKTRLQMQPPSTAMTVEDKAALALLNGAIVSGRVDANNAAQSARQLASLAQADEKTVFQALIHSGAVNAADLMEAAKRADKDADLNPKKAGSLTNAVFSALQDIAAERSVDPFTDAIDYALTADGNPNKQSELIRLMNRWETQAEKTKDPDAKKSFEEGVNRAKTTLDLLREKGSSAADKGNSIFESASQPVKDILLSKPGNKMKTATYKDVADAIDEVQQNKVEVAMALVHDKADAIAVRASGEVLNILGKMKALGESLFTDSFLARITGAQGVKIKWESLAQDNPDAKEYLRLRKALAGTMGRAFGGERGVMTEGDINRSLESMPDPSDFIPDSKATFLKVVEDLEDMSLSKVQARFNPRVLDALKGGTTADRQAANDALAIIEKAKKRQGLQ